MRILRSACVRSAVNTQTPATGYSVIYVKDGFTLFVLVSKQGLQGKKLSSIGVLCVHLGL